MVQKKLNIRPLHFWLSWQGPELSADRSPKILWLSAVQKLGLPVIRPATMSSTASFVSSAKSFRSSLLVLVCIIFARCRFDFERIIYLMNDSTLSLLLALHICHVWHGHTTQWQLSLNCSMMICTQSLMRGLLFWSIKWIVIFYWMVIVIYCHCNPKAKPLIHIWQGTDKLAVLIQTQDFTMSMLLFKYLSGIMLQGSMQEACTEW